MQSDDIATLREEHVVRGTWREEPFEPTKPLTVDNPAVRVVRAIVRARETGVPALRGHLLVDVRYPPNFPFEPPQVVPVDLRYRQLPHQDAVTGALCWQLEEAVPWLPTYGIRQALAGATQWFEGFLSGGWDTAPPVTEIERYFRTTSTAVRMLLLPPDATPPPSAQWGRLQVELALGRSGVGVLGTRWQHQHDGAAEASKDRDARAAIWSALQHPSPHRAIDGLWIRLDAEPPPFNTLDALRTVLATHAGGLSAAAFHARLARTARRSLRQVGWVPVGLYYPAAAAPHGGLASPRPSRRWEWVFFAIEVNSLGSSRGSAARVTARAMRLKRDLAGIPSYDVLPAAAQPRQGTLTLPATLADAHVMMVGVGALGSTIARSLAAAGVGRFTLVDADIMKPGNVVRHELRFPDVAQRKTTALAQVLRETNPFVHVEEITGGSRQRDRAIERQMLDANRRPTLVIVATAVKSVEVQLDMLAARAGSPLPVLHAWVAASAQLLRAFLYRPGRTPCTLCVECYRHGALSATSAYIGDPSVPDNTFYEKSCAAPTHVGTGNANALAAHVVVEMALLALDAGSLPDSETHWLFAGNRIHTVAPGYAVAPLSRVTCDLVPHADCPVCRAGGMITTVTNTTAGRNPEAA